MAVLHFQAPHSVAPHNVTQPGASPVLVPPPITMVLQGPRVQASITIPGAFSAQLLAQGKAVPAPIIGSALIDTGAGITCIDETAARNAGLPIIDVINLGSASHSLTPKPVFPIQIELIGTNIKVEIPRAAGGELSSQGLLLLIGRDFLADCVLVYNGGTGIATLAK